MYTHDPFQQNFPVTRQELAHRILLELAKNPGLKASQLAYRIGKQIGQKIQRHNVNSILYSEFRFKVRQDKNYCWYTLADFPTAKTKKADTRIEPMFEPRPIPPKPIVPPITPENPKPVFTPTQNVGATTLTASKNHSGFSFGQFFIGVGVIATLCILLIKAPQREDVNVDHTPYEASVQPAAPVQPQVIFDTVVIENEPKKIDPVTTQRLLNLYRDIVRLEKDTTEIGQSINDMQSDQDAGLGENVAELRYARGYQERVAELLAQKQDSVRLLTMWIEK